MNRFEASPLPFETFIESHAIMKKLPLTKTEGCTPAPVEQRNDFPEIRFAQRCFVFLRMQFNAYFRFGIFFLQIANNRFA